MCRLVVGRILNLPCYDTPRRRLRAYLIHSHGRPYNQLQSDLNPVGLLSGRCRGSQCDRQNMRRYLSYSILKQRQSRASRAFEQTPVFVIRNHVMCSTYRMLCCRTWNKNGTPVKWVGDRPTNYRKMGDRKKITPDSAHIFLTTIFLYPRKIR